MSTTKCECCGGDVVDGAQRYHHLARCVEYKEEGVDHVVCQCCGYRSTSLSKHIKLHGISAEEYRTRHPGHGIVLRKIVEKQSLSKSSKGGYKPISERSDAVYCDKCDKHYLQRFAKQHLEKCVPAYPDKYTEGQDYVRCPECGCALLRIGQHLKLKHGWTNDRLQMASNEGLRLTAQCVVDRWKSKQDFKAAQKKREQTHFDKHGYKNPFSDPNIQEKIKETSQRRYGADHAMQNEDVRIRQNESAQDGPSELERFFDEHTCDSVVFTGYGGRYIRCKQGVEKYGRVIKDLNPDFMVLPDNVLESARNRSDAREKMNRERHRTKYVIELLGDYYHSEQVIGVPPERHKQEVIDAYASVGIECLVLWEHEVLQEWEYNRERIEDWLERAIADINEHPVWSKRTKARVDGRKATIQCPYGSGRTFKTDASLRRWMDSPKNYWRPGLEEGRDYVVCGECGERCQKLTEHLRKTHGMTKGEYLEVHEGALLVASVISEAVSRSCSENPRRQKGHSRDEQGSGMEEVTFFNNEQS